MDRIFVTGIGTDIGKTIVSAVLTEALGADYWKPVQAGNLEDSDTMFVQRMVSNTQTVFHPEAYRLQAPLSPHDASSKEGIEISMEKINAPETSNTLIIEGAGGLMVPLNKKEFVIDLIQKLEAEVVLVSKNYLGSINHSLLSIEALQNRNIPIKGIVFNGPAYPKGEEVILNFAQTPMLGRLDWLPELSPDAIQQQAVFFRDQLKEIFHAA